MSDEFGQEASEAVAPEVDSQAVSTDAGEFSGHPAWKPFQDTLGDFAYHQIEPHLREMSRNFEGKVASTNKSYEPWKAFADEGVNPEDLRMAHTAFTEINGDPVGFYRKLEGYLRENGMLEAAAQVAAQGQATKEAQEADPDEDPQIAQLKQQLAALQEGQQAYQQEQQQRYAEVQRERATQQEYSKLEGEVQALQAQGVDKDTMRRVLDRAQLHHFQTGKALPLADAHRQVEQEIAAIRNQPRPVDRAPRLPGVTGGAPAPAATDLSTASRQQSVDTLAALLAANRG